MPDLNEVINQLQESAKEIVEQRAKADALFSSMGDGAIVTDEKGNISRINQAALDMLGFGKKELIGQWFPKAIMATTEEGDAIEPFDRIVTNAFMKGKAASGRTWYLTKPGRQIPVFVTVSPIMLNDKPVGAIEVFRDISHDLEVDRMKSEFISIASHQLRTPLSAINTYASLVATGFHGPLNKDQKELMDVILTSAEKMNDLITVLLDISRLEAGKLHVNIQKVDLNELLETILQELSPLAEDRNIQILVKSPSANLITKSDPLLLGEIYTNLISNAIKYSRDNGKIDIELQDAANKIVFSVHDNGYGIPENQQKRVFTKFFRATNVSKRDTNGTGLGLYMAKQVAELLQGRLWFESRPKRGSTFYFSLQKRSL